MGQLEDLNLFSIVVENKSISKAAEKLNIAKSAVSRRLSLLENRYELCLIDREPGVWNLTDAGQELYQRAKRVVNDFEEIENDFMKNNYDIDGPLTISVPRDFGISYLKDSLISFKSLYPKIQLSIDFDDHLINLERENYDFALRITKKTDDNLISQKIGIVRHQLCASPSYLKKYGVPKTLKDLSSHKLLHYGSSKRASWTLINKDHKKPNTLDFQPALNSNSGNFLRSAALKGLGIVNLPDFIVSEPIKNKTLVPIIPLFNMSDYFIYLVHSENRRMNRRMRLFYKHLKFVCDLN